MRYIAVVILFLPYYGLDFITKISPRLHKNTILWFDRKIGALADLIDAWEKNTPENTMELLKKDFTK